MLTTGFLSVAPVPSLVVPSSLFLLVSSVCKSLQYLTSTLTQGGEGGHLFRLTCSIVLWGVCPCPRHVFFPSLHCSGSRLLCRKLSEAGPGLCAFPRSKPLRFRFSSTPQRRRFIWACILYPSQVRAAQVTRCLMNTTEHVSLNK